MTVTTARPTQPGRATTPSAPVAAAIGALAVAGTLGAMLGPDLTVNRLGMDMTMGMTHYMELLATNQPVNLLLFMGVPVVIAETLAISEIAVLFTRQPAWVRSLNRLAGLLAGPVMLAIFTHLLLHAVVPLTASGGWRGPADVLAVGFYLAGAVPFVGITLVELGLLGRTERDANRMRATGIAVFLVVAHVAMIFGMMDPAVLGYVMAHH